MVSAYNHKKMNIKKTFNQIYKDAIKSAGSTAIKKACKYNRKHCLMAQKIGCRIIKNSTLKELEYLDKAELLNLGKTAFLYHDVGRFTETDKKQNIPHGKSGAKVLKDIGIDNPLVFLPVLHHSSNDSVVLQHNGSERDIIDLELSSDEVFCGLSEQDKKYARVLTYVIRDADLLSSPKNPFNKVKSFVGTYAKNNHSGISTSDFTINDELVEYIKSGKSITQDMVHNPAELGLLFISRYFALTFNASRKEYRRQRMHKRIMRGILRITPKVSEFNISKFRRDIIPAIV
jgi:hypothetical protein